MSSWVSAILGTGFGVSVVAAVLGLARLFASRGIVKANTEQLRAAAADQLSDIAADMVRQIRDDARQQIEAARGNAEQAKNEAVQARRDADEARREAVDARREAMDAAREFRRLKSAILSPYATLEHLREMVGDTGSNGPAAVGATH